MIDQNDVHLAITGDKDAFARLVKMCEPMMYRVAKSILSGDPDCADAIQETIWRAYRSLSSLREPAFFKTWLIRILINESKRIKANEKRVIPLQTIEDIYSKDVQVQGTYDVREMLRFLDDDLHMTVTFFYLEDLSLREIAEMMEVPVGTVKSRLHRAREKLSQLFATNKGRSRL